MLLGFKELKQKCTSCNPSLCDANNRDNEVGGIKDCQGKSLWALSVKTHHNLEISYYLTCVTQADTLPSMSLWRLGTILNIGMCKA